MMKQRMMRLHCVWGICVRQTVDPSWRSSWKTGDTLAPHLLDRGIHPPSSLSFCLSLHSFPSLFLRFSFSGFTGSGFSKTCGNKQRLFSHSSFLFLWSASPAADQREGREGREDNAYEWHLLSLSLISSFSGGKKEEDTDCESEEKEKGIRNGRHFILHANSRLSVMKEGKWKAKFPPLCSVDPSETILLPNCYCFIDYTRRTN